MGALRPSALVAATVLVVGAIGAPTTAGAAEPSRVNLRVLVVTNGDPGSTAIAAELDRQGVPRTTVGLADPSRPTIDAAFLEDAAAGVARYQAVVLPNQAGGGLAAEERAALAAYEAKYAIRQVNAYDYPTPTMGVGYPTSCGPLDGATVTVTASGLAGSFGYLRGTFTVDDVDPGVAESYGCLAPPLSAMPPGETFEPLLTAAQAGTTGTIAGVHTAGGREELAIFAAFNADMAWFNVIAEGIVDWATRGIRLGLQRNHLNVHVDDVLMGDSRWSVEGNCTPGEDCPAGITTTDVRMTAADVKRLVDWQAASGFRLDLVFNGYGSDQNGGTHDPLTAALLANRAKFRWVNHTYSHSYLGCIQVAPTVAGQPWTCMTDPSQGPRIDPDIPARQHSDGVYYATPAWIIDEVWANVDWAARNHLPNFDPAELVTGEHSGLWFLPQQPIDNPFLADALAAELVTVTASDASRDPGTRLLQDPNGSSQVATLPRHPINVFFNVGTYAEEVDEYNWIYTSVADGGSGLCESHPETMTCITALPAASAAEARASFTGPIVDQEVRNALRFVLANDPRPFYVHQSNLAEDAILYPVLDGILGTYGAIFDTATTPLVQGSLTQQQQVLARMEAWSTASAAPTVADAYVDIAGVHIPATAAPTPLTVPSGSTGSTALQAYGGSLSGWLDGAATTVAVPVRAGGYLVTAPSAPTGVVATAGAQSATVRWVAPFDGNSPITSSTVYAFAGTSTTPAATVRVDGPATSVEVTGLRDGTAYRFSVESTNAIGTGPRSALSAAVTPRAHLAAPATGVTGQPGNASASITWVQPANTTGITGYQVRAFVGAAGNVARSTTVGATRTSAALDGLANGTGYTVEVVAMYGGTAGTASARSAVFVPDLFAQADAAPAIVAVVPARQAVTVTWAPPVDTQAGTPSGYRVRAFQGATSTKEVKAISVTGSVTSVQMTGLKSGVEYSVEVRAQYGSGMDPYSARSGPVRVL